MNQVRSEAFSLTSWLSGRAYADQPRARRRAQFRAEKVGMTALVLRQKLESRIDICQGTGLFRQVESRYRPDLADYALICGMIDTIKPRCTQTECEGVLPGCSYPQS